jgi:hypothetical protein
MGAFDPVEWGGRASAAGFCADLGEWPREPKMSRDGCLDSDALVRMTGCLPRSCRRAALGLRFYIFPVLAGAFEAFGGMPVSRFRQFVILETSPPRVM